MTQKWCLNCPTNVTASLSSVPLTNRFRVVVRGQSSWQITVSPPPAPSQPLLFVRHTSDGTNLFIYRHTDGDNAAVVAARAAGLKRDPKTTSTSGILQITRLAVPPANEDNATSVLWLAFLSGEWLKRIDGELLPHLHNNAPVHEAHRNAIWSSSLTNGCGGLLMPRSISVQANGTYRPGGTTNGPLLHLQAPFDRGFEQGAYSASGWTTAREGCSFPMAGVLVQRWPVPTGDSKTLTNAPRLFATFSVTNVSVQDQGWVRAHESDEDLPVIVEDFRLSQDAATPVTYVVSNLSQPLVEPDTRRALAVAVTHAEMTKLTAERLAKSASKASSRRWILATLFLCSVGAMVLRGGRRRDHISIICFCL